MLKLLNGTRSASRLTDHPHPFNHARKKKAFLIVVTDEWRGNQRRWFQKKELHCCGDSLRKSDICGLRGNECPVVVLYLSSPLLLLLLVHLPREIESVASGHPRYSGQQGSFVRDMRPSLFLLRSFPMSEVSNGEKVKAHHAALPPFFAAQLAHQVARAEGRKSYSR